MKVYLSGRITGNSGYYEEFAEAEEMLTELGYSVINPARINAQLPSDTTWEQYMSVSITLLSQADAIYLLRGYEWSRGANRELGYAMGAGLMIMEQK